MADGELEQAVSACRDLAADYIADGTASALDLSAVLKLLAKARKSIFVRVPDAMRPIYVLRFHSLPVV